MRRRARTARTRRRLAGCRRAPSAPVARTGRTACREAAAATARTAPATHTRSRSRRASRARAAGAWDAEALSARLASSPVPLTPALSPQAGRGSRATARRVRGLRSLARLDLRPQLVPQPPLRDGQILQLLELLLQLGRRKDGRQLEDVGLDVAHRVLVRI